MYNRSNRRRSSKFYDQQSMFSSFDEYDTFDKNQKEDNSSFSSFQSINISKMPSFSSHARNQLFQKQRQNKKVNLNPKDNKKFHNTVNMVNNANNYNKISLNSSLTGNIRPNSKYQQSLILQNNSQNNNHRLLKNQLKEFHQIESFRHQQPLNLIDKNNQNKHIYNIVINKDKQKDKNKNNNKQFQKNEKYTDLPLKNNHLLKLNQKIQQIAKIKDQTIAKNHQLRKQNQILKQKLKKYHDHDKKLQLLNKQNSLLKIEIQKMKNKQSSSKIDLQISDKNSMLIQVQKLHQKCRQLQIQTKQKVELREKQIILKYQQQIQKIKQIGAWRDKFVSVFLDMIQKIPISIDPSWNKKKKVRIGWKAVKLMIKKSLKFGIQPPTTQIIQ